MSEHVVQWEFYWKKDLASSFEPHTFPEGEYDWVHQKLSRHKKKRMQQIDVLFKDQMDDELNSQSCENVDVSQALSAA